MPLVDTHCHLDFAELADDFEAVIQRAASENVAALIVPAVTADRFETVTAVAQRTVPFCIKAAYGLHPYFLAEHTPDDLAQLERYLTTHTAVAVGEIGLDFAVAQTSDARAQQVDYFVAQLKLAQRLGLPVVIHAFRAVEVVIQLLRQTPVIGGVVHAFNGSEAQAHQLMRLNFALGFGGAMTFTGSRKIRHLAASLPLSCIVLETDAPDMRPAWARHQPNEPAVVRRYAEVLAALRHESVAAVIACTGERARALFQLPI